MIMPKNGRNYLKVRVLFIMDYWARELLSLAQDKRTFQLGNGKK
jgi:hypothetical protein